METPRRIQARTNIRFKFHLSLKSHDGWRVLTLLRAREDFIREEKIYNELCGKIFFIHPVPVNNVVRLYRLLTEVKSLSRDLEAEFDFPNEKRHERRRQTLCCINNQGISVSKLFLYTHLSLRFSYLNDFIVIL